MSVECVALIHKTANKIRTGFFSKSFITKKINKLIMKKAAPLHVTKALGGRGHIAPTHS
jgi:hypothetical protein